MVDSALENETTPYKNAYKKLWIPWDLVMGISFISIIKIIPLIKRFPGGYGDANTCRCPELSWVKCQGCNHGIVM